MRYVIAVCLMLASCGSGGGANPETEPNDTDALANHMGVLTYDRSGVLSGRVGDGVDFADWFAFDAIDDEGVGIGVAMTLVYVVEDLSEASLRVFFDGVDLGDATAGPVDFYVEPTLFAGNTATIEAYAGALSVIHTGRLVFCVESVSGAASYTLTWRAERE